MNSCFLVYPWEQIDTENDTSLASIHTYFNRDHGVATCRTSILTIRNSETNAFCKVISKVDKILTK